jgi:arsenate reductase-like glutaredoxin family protein
VTSGKTAQALMILHPALIKRPVVVSGKRIHVGYDETAFETLCK